MRSGGTLRIVNNAPDEGPHTFTVVKKSDLPKTPRAIFNCAICNKLGAGPRGRPEQRGAAEVPVPRERRRLDDRAERRPRRRLGLHRRQEGRVGDAQGHGEEGRDAALHLPHPPVDAGQGPRPLGAPLAAPRPRRLPGPGRGGRSPDRRPGRRAGARLLGRRRADDVERRAQRARRDHGHARRHRRRGVPDRRLPALHARVAAAVGNAPRASADGLAIPGPLLHARVGDRLRVHFKNLDTLRRDAALDALPRRPLQAQLGRRLPARVLRARRRGPPRAAPTPTA